MKKITVTLTPAQMREVLEIISQMTDGNAYDYDEMKKCGVKSPHTLVSAEKALRTAWENALTGVFALPKREKRRGTSMASSKNGVGRRCKA